MSVEASTQPPVGVVFSSRYKLVRLLGEGGMGAVFEAQDLAGSSRCAIKVLHPEYARQERILASFFAEAEQSSRLTHPNIARCFGYAQAEDGSPYQILELLEGSSLSSYLKPGLAYASQYAIPIVRGLLAALGEAHRQGVVHRDVKPDNVFLIPSPEGPSIVKVLDFGMAKVMDAAGGMMTRTRTGVLLGMPSYMSPEQIRNSKEVGPRADLWSAAVILYWLLTGRDAFAAPTEVAKLTMILTSEPPFVDRGKPELLPWRGFFARALARDFERRFATAAEMEQAMTTTDQASRGLAPQLASTTDISLEMPRGTARSRPPQIQVVETVPARPNAGTLPGSDSIIRAGPMPVLGLLASRVAVWVAFLVSVICLIAGFLAGFVAGRF